MSADDGWTKAKALDLAVTRCLDALEDGATLLELVAGLRAAGIPVLLDEPEESWTPLDLDPAVPCFARAGGLDDVRAWAERDEAESRAQTPKYADHEQRMVDKMGEELAAPLIAAMRAQEQVNETAARDRVLRVLPFGYAMTHPDGLPEPRPGYRWELTGAPGVTPSLQEWREVPVIGPKGESLGTLGEVMIGPVPSSLPSWSTGPGVSVGELAEAHARHSGAVEEYKPLTPADVSGYYDEPAGSSSERLDAAWRERMEHIRREHPDRFASGFVQLPPGVMGWLYEVLGGGEE